jgi:outer membrane protein OmpA-like peptidoglycan-associated protein
MSHVHILIGVAAVAVAAGLGLHSHLSSQDPEPQQPATRAGTAGPEIARLLAPDVARDAGRPSGSTGSGFDIVRIDPNGASVLAGRATPNAEVVIMANGQPVATVKADASGDWTTVTAHRFEAGKQELTLNEKAGGNAPVRTAAVEVQVAVGAADVAPRPAPSPPVRIAAAGDVKALTEALQADPARPVPITFVYREATLTEDGRKAVDVLAAYLAQKKPDSVTLSGHADERGGHKLNMDLSRERLDAVARQLRQGGYAGKLVLMPKGKTEPFTGIDRRAMPRQIVYQMDRRVELRVQ